MHREGFTTPDTWFTLEVLAQGRHIVIKVNGKKTVDFIDEQHAFRRGHFALQQNGAQAVAHFRKIEVQELPADDAN